MAYETTEQLLAEISDYWDKRPGSNLYKLIDAFNGPFGELGTNANKVERWRALKDAKGTTLDLFGKDIQTYRPSADDDEYRFVIHIMELLSRAQGTIPSMYKIMSSALETKDGFKIWRTHTRHVGVQIPFDYVKSVRMQKFITSHIQYMLAMGYWIEDIVFVTKSDLPLYLGTATQSKFHETQRSTISWWDGWKAKTPQPLYLGIHSNIQEKRHVKSTVSWWDGWKAKAEQPLYLGTHSTYLKHTTQKSSVEWWSGWEARAPQLMCLGVAGRIIKTTVWKTAADWYDSKTEEIHAGLNIGNKLITQTTQSLKTE